MEGFRADLHTHTTSSDGSCTPLELLQAAQAKNLGGLSITDHDTVDAYPGLFEQAARLGIRLVTGVEFSAALGPTPIHILGYAFNSESPLILDYCRRHVLRRAERNRAILDRLRRHGMHVTDDELSERKVKKGGTIGRPHIAQAMVEKGYVGSIQEAFYRYLGEGKLCYEPGSPMTVEDTIDCLHRAGGFAVIAHPHLIDPKSAVRELVELPFDGVEAYYARFPLDQIQRWLKLAEK